MLSDLSLNFQTDFFVQLKFKLIPSGWTLDHPLLLLTLVQNQVVFEASRSDGAGVAVAALVHLRVHLLISDIVLSKSWTGVEVHITLLTVETLRLLWRHLWLI